MPLINSIEILKQYVPGFNKDGNFKQMLLWVQKAERSFVMPKIGPELYKALEEYRDDEAYQLLREYAERTVAWYAYYLAMPYLDITVGDLGLKIQNTPNTEQIPKWKYIEMLRQTADTADQEMEELLNLLYSKADDYPEWLNSTTYQKCNEYFLRSARELSLVLPLAQNRYRTYTALQPYMDLCEYELREMLTDELMDDLKAKWKQPGSIGLPAGERKLVDLLKRYIGPKSMSLALPDIKFRLYPDGLKISTYEDAFAQQPTGAQERISQEQEDKLQRSHVAALTKIRTYLDDHASESLFPSYYQRKVSTPQRIPLFLTNTDKKSFIL